MELAQSVIVELGGFVALFAVIEQILKAETRLSLGKFIFGRRGATFPEFELNTISGLVGPFVVEGTLRWRRVFVLSLSVSFLTIVIGQLSAYPGTGDLGERFWINVLSVIPTALVALPFDWWSLRVTKWFFIDRRPVLPVSLASFVADIVLSALPLLLPLFVFFLVLASAYYTSKTGEVDYSELENILLFSLIIGMIANSVSSLVISMLQLIIIFVGSILRFVFQVTRLGAWLARKTDIEKYPLSFIGLVLGLVFTMAS